MAVYTTNLQVDQNADFSQSFVWVTGPGLGPVLLAGATARLMARVNPTDPSPLLSLTTTTSSSGSIVLGAMTGLVTVNISKNAFTNYLFYLGPPPTYDLFIDFPGPPAMTIPFLTGNLLIRATDTH